MRVMYANRKTTDRGESWRPEPGDTLVGRVDSYRDVVTRYGPARVLSLVEDVTRKIWSVWISSVVLRGEFEAQDPKVGERVVSSCRYSTRTVMSCSNTGKS